MEPQFVYKKDPKLEEIDDKIAEIISEVIYSYMIRKSLLKSRIFPASEKELDNNYEKM